MVRTRLEHLDLAGLDVELGAASRVTIARAEGLRGALSVEGGRVDGSGVVAKRLELAAVALAFGRVTIGADPGTTFESVQSSFTKAGGVIGELTATHTTAVRVIVTVGEVAISGRVELGEARVQLDGKIGQVTAERVALSEVSLVIGDTAVAIENIVGTRVAIAWGAPGLRVEIGSVEVAAATARTALPPRESSDGAGSSRATGFELPEPLVRLLDGISGQLDVDVQPDVTLPVIGHRRATHEFRLPIDRGTIDFMTLEHGLSRLEDSVIDFSVRGDDLVLERGIPILPTRGKGKPIVRWHLAGVDVELAQRDRIRLAALPQFTLASAEDDAGEPTGEPSSGGSKKVALVELEVKNLDAKLAIDVAEPLPALPVQSVAELAVTGQLAYDAEGEPRAGELRGRLSQIQLAAGAIAAGKRSVAFEWMRIAEVPEARASFLGLVPQSVELAVRGVSLSGLRIAPR